MIPSPTLRSIADLEAAALTAPADRAALEQVAARYAVALTPAVVALIDPGKAQDPIGRQFVPSRAELAHHPAERADPIGDAAHSPVPGLVHRYPDRVLLKVVAACAVYCRFCFRRESVGPGRDGGLNEADLAGALDYIRARPQIWEVILTGGDPLVLGPRRLAAISEQLRAIEHVQIVRIHTRVPAVAPERVTEALLDAIAASGKTTYVALHANHPRELTVAARAACARIIDRGFPMVSQTVLLRGVNDDVETLATLMRAFVGIRIKPYYLHHGDLAPGTAHFRTTIAEGRALMRALQGSLSGLCQPAYVLDIPGGHGKAPIGPHYASAGADAGNGEYEIQDFSGLVHGYGDATGTIKQIG